MKKILKIIIACAIPALGVASAYAEYDPAYYSRMEGLKKSALKAAAKECVKAHRQLVYIDLPNYWYYSDTYPEKINGALRWWDMYSNEIELIRAGQSGKAAFSANKMQREHCVPKSWWKTGNDVEYTPCYSDMWNLYPSNGEANQSKSNYPLGIVSTASYDNGAIKVGLPASGQGGGAGYVFEPDDEYKGDFARAYFYVATVYDDIAWQSRYDWVFVKEAYPTLRPWAVETLLQWARQDPVSQKEILRNDAVEQSQGNRNPFVDFPELAEFIWGTRTLETFRIAEQGGAVTPPITGDPELTQPLNGEYLDFSQTALGVERTEWLVLRGKNFTAPLSVKIGGKHRAMFSLPVTEIPASAINSTGEYMLPVTYCPTELGSHQAVLGIYDGGLAGSIRVDLKGEGLKVPALTAVTALPPTNMDEDGYTANWKKALEVVDFYVFERTRYLPDGAETDQHETMETSWDVTDRDPQVAESYVVYTSRLGFLSPVSNQIDIEGAGIKETLEEATAIGVIDRGIVALAEEGVENVRIFNASGMLILEKTHMARGEEIALPAGIWIITAEGAKPMKLIISNK